MTNPQVFNNESRKLYEGKYFYEVVKGFDTGSLNRVRLCGPLDNIYYLTEKHEYAFVQVVDGTLGRVFKEREILVTDRIL